MSVFRGELGDVTDVKKIVAYLYKLNEQLSYMFGNMTPEDNYSPDALEKYIEAGESALEVKLAVDDMKINMVKKGEVVASINMSPEEIKIMAAKISLEGIVTANQYFKILLDGSMEAKNGKFSGELNAESGKIAGWTIKEGLLEGDDSSLIKGGKIEGSSIKGGNVEGTSIKGGNVEGTSIKGGNIEGTTVKGTRISGSSITGSRIEASEIGDREGRFYTDGMDVYIGGFRAYETTYSQYLATIGTEENGIGDSNEWALWAGWDGDVAAFAVDTGGYVKCSEIYSEVAGESWSDERRKDQIESLDLKLAAEIVKNLRPVTFVTKKKGKPGIGFIAQEVYLLCKKLGCDLPLYGFTRDCKFFTIPYQHYIALTVAAQKQMMEEMQELREEIRELKERMV